MGDELAFWTPSLVADGYRSLAQKWNPSNAAIRMAAAGTAEIRNRRTFPLALLRVGGDGGSGLKFLK